MRQMLTEETIAYNAECFKRQMEKFIDFSDGKAIMLRNSAWLKPLNYIELLREVGAASPSTTCSARNATSREWKRA